MRTATIAWTNPGAKSSRPVSGGGMRGPGCIALNLAKHSKLLASHSGDIAARRTVGAFIPAKRVDVEP